LFRVAGIGTDYEYIPAQADRKNMVVNKLKLPKNLKETEQPEVDWDNPSNPEKAQDKRDLEQLLRQKKEAERRKDNLTDDPKEANGK